MKKQQTCHIAHKAPVSEREFLDYLQKVCQDKYVKSLILSYYKKLRALDHKYGKQLSAKSYGLVPFSSVYGDNLPDQVKYLFGVSKIQKAAANFAENFGENACEMLKKTPLPEKTLAPLIYARNKYLQYFLDKHDNVKIGKADLFRWQFLNYLQQVDSQKKEASMLRGFINFTDGELVMLRTNQNTKTTEETAQQYYTDKTTVFHELTHLMSLKSFANGNYKYIHDSELQDSCGYNTALPNFLAECEKQDKALKLYASGLEILNEVITEKVASAHISNILSAQSETFFECFENCPTLQSVHLAPVKDKCYVVHSEYQYFGHALELILALNGQDLAEVISPNRVPTEKLYEIVENFFSLAYISPKLEEQLNRRLANKLKTSPCLFENADTYHKFILLLGIMYQTFEASVADTHYLEKSKNFNSAYNRDAMLLQAVILEIHKNKFLEIFKNPEFQKNSQSYDSKKAKTFLASYANLASYADDWVIKPNIKSNNQEDFLRKTSATLHLAKLNPNNLAIVTWANFLKIIIFKSNEFAPEIFEKNIFLKNEHKYLKNNENNLEK